MSEANTPRAPVVVSVRPEPEPAVLAAIVAAVEEAWPRPRADDDGGGPRQPPWRFSGRWWTQPAALRRDRPRSSR
ncbi:MAG TPA: hypothetical protein VMU64_07660 [Acidimicrobiales bacterium]|nr:hypothetical protein [Acidimicrobiales bacterium]